MFTPSCTVTAFLSDNGGAVSNSGSNWPLRGSKHTLWEGGVRVPALLHGPGLPAARFSGLVHMVDILPSLLELAAAPVPPGLDGISQWGALRGATPPPRTRMVYNVRQPKLFK